MNNNHTPNSASRPRPPRIFAALLLVIGLALVAGGVGLAVLGGSLYYIVTGPILIASAVLLLARESLGSQQYVVIAVPALETPKDSHVVEPEAQRGAGRTALAKSPDGGWLIAYARPGGETR